MTLRKRAAAIGDTPPRPFGREICNQMPNPSISAPPPRSYRLRRHFPRHCDVTTRVLHPYKPRFLRKEGTAGSPAAAPSSRHFTVRYRNCSCPAFSHGHTPSVSRLISGILRRRADRHIRTSCAGRIPAAPASHPGRKRIFGYRDSRHPKYYQLAFFTPGIRPFEAISRNWIRLMPNRRM